MSEFGFATCLPGFEECLKIEVRQRFPDFKFAYSRRGFVTWKAPASVDAFAEGDPLVFAQLQGWSLGKGDAPGSFRVVIADSDPEFVLEGADDGAETNGRILGSVGLQGETWSVQVAAKQRESLTRLRTIQSEIQKKPVVPSRAYFKAREVLIIADQHQIIFPKAEPVIDVGSAPGGASFAFLEAGFKVFGIDPAKMHSLCLEHPKFEHIATSVIQAIQSNAAPRGLVFVDMNVRPEIVLDQLREWLASTNVRYLVCTWKIPQKGLAIKIPSWKKRLEEFGFSKILVKQLLSNAQEVTAIALKK